MPKWSERKQLTLELRTGYWWAGDKINKRRILLVKSQIFKNNQGKKCKVFFFFFPNDLNNAFQLVHEDS